MRTRIQFLTILLLSAFILNAQQKHVLSVREAVELAFKNLAEVKNAELDYKIQEAQNEEIFGQALPQIIGNASAAHYLKLPEVLFPQSEEGIYTVLKRE